MVLENEGGDSSVTASVHEVAADSGMRIERVTSNIGALVHGVDVRETHPDPVAARLRQWLHEHGVLFFHSDDVISDDEYRSFASLFGEIEIPPYGSQEVPDRSITHFDFEDSTRAVQTRTTTWHTDGVSSPTPPQAALLSPLRLPSVGGDTMWATMNVAFETLSSRYQRLLDGMEALHSTDAVKRHFPSAKDREMFGQGESSVHPVVLTDPVTHRRILYVNANWTERLVGMSEWESSKILEMLFDHINTPEFHVRLRWQPNMVAVWEERVTQHRGVADYDEPRVLRRITIRGDRPTA